MNRKNWIYGFVVLISVIIIISYGIDKKNEKLLQLKTAERLSVKNLYEQMEFTNSILSSNDPTLLAKVQTVDSNNQYFTYLSHSFDQYYIHMVSLGLAESQNFRDVEDIWRTYLRNIVDISEININEIENLEKRLLEMKNKINNEEANMRKKIDNSLWR